MHSEEKGCAAIQHLMEEELRHDKRGSDPSSCCPDLRVAWLYSLMHLAIDFFGFFILDIIFWNSIEVASYWNSIEVVSSELCNVACISA
jgi:hypothetical protein